MALVAVPTSQENVTDGALAGFCGRISSDAGEVVLHAGQGQRGAGRKRLDRGDRVGLWHCRPVEAAGSEFDLRPLVGEQQE